MTTRIVYHSKDYDGKASACLAIYGTNGDYTLHPYDYGDPIPDFMQWPPGDTIYLLDVSFPKPTMIGLWSAFQSRFIWIDHHESAIELCKDFPIPGLRRVGVAACALMWEYLFGHNGLSPLPPGLKLISKYDVWDKSDGCWKTHTLPYQFGLNVNNGNCPDPQTPAGIEFCHPSDSEGALHHKGRILKVITQGKAALAALQNQFKFETDRYGYTREFAGLRALCINAPNISSMRLEESFDPDRHDLMLIWCVSTRGIKVSLYSTKSVVDCSVLAQRYGGGGHVGAAGFVLPVERLGEVAP